MHTLHSKTPYELVHDKKPDLLFLCIFGALCYLTNDSEDLRKLKAKVDIGTLCTPTNKELEILFQPTFDEYFEPPTVNRLVPPAHAAQVLDNPTGLSVSIFVDQDAPSTSHSPSSLDPQSSFVHQGVADSNSFKVNLFAPTDNCFYNSVLSKVEPKTSNCWFEAMQEEIHEFDRLQVWELVPPLDCAMIIALKWIYKVKLDEYGDVLKNKARLVAKGYREEEGIDREESFVPDTTMALTAYADVDHAGCQDTHRSTSFLGDKLVSWSSKKQTSTLISIYRG
nr:retrovirus-related Pol polyprotein from transposon TNT 1-94 [Tanacetum cinerariifolium]